MLEVFAVANSPAAAVKKAKSITSGYKGLCLVFVRTCYGVGAKFPSAADAWAGAKVKHSASSTTQLPVGAPVFFSVPGNKYGHVALYLGNGLFRTNYSAKGTVITAGLTHPVFSTMKMLGWVEDLNGAHLSGLAPVKSDGRIAKWQRSMNTVFPSYANFAVDGEFGPYSEQVTRTFQQRAGIKVTGQLDALTVKTMRKYGVKI